MAIPITTGQGQASVASELIGTDQYQKIKVVGGETGSTSVWGIAPDGSAKVSVIGVVNIAGSVASIPTGNQSISGAVTAPPGSVMMIAQLPGSILATSATVLPGSVSGAVTAPPGSVMMVAQLAGSVLAVSGSFSPSGNQSVSGAVTAPPGSIASVRINDLYQEETVGGPSIRGIAIVWESNANSSVMSTVSPTNPLRVLGSVSGAVTHPAGSITAVSGATTTTPGSIISATFPAGSVAAVNFANSSIIAINAGSVIALLGNTSIAGTFLEDSAHTTGDRGFNMLGVRNDLMASVTGADLDYSPISVGPVGENIIANAPINKWLQGRTDHRVSLGGSLIAIAKQGASVFTYVTAVQVANMGPSSVLVTLGGGLGSVLGYTIAPAGGGSNIVYPNALKTGENSDFTTSISGISSVLVSVQGFSAKI